MNILLKITKNIFCVNEYSDNCQKCFICHQIDNLSFPDLKIIEPTNGMIRKPEIVDLRYTLSKSSQITNKYIYIIKECEKMNKDSSNTILKFLEEPSENVYGFYITKNAEDIIPTIKSRCQQIDVMFENDESEYLGIKKEKYEELLIKCSEYLNEIETIKKKYIIINREHFIDYEKEDYINFFKTLLDIYRRLLEGTLKDTRFDFLSNLSPKNIKLKINLIIEILKEINYNINIEMLLDRFVIEMDGINHDVV